MSPKDLGILRQFDIVKESDDCSVEDCESIDCEGVDCAECYNDCDNG